MVLSFESSERNTRRRKHPRNDRFPSWTGLIRPGGLCFFHVEFWPVAPLRDGVGLNCQNQATPGSAICAHFARKAETAPSIALSWKYNDTASTTPLLVSAVPREAPTPFAATARFAMAGN